MGKPSLSRRDFFRSFTLTSGPGDPLFEKYSRKTLGPRSFSNEIVDYFRQGAESTSNESSVRVGNVTSGLAPYTGAWTEREALHLIRRTTFGNKVANVAPVVNAGMVAAVDGILTIDYTVPTPPPVNWYNVLAVDAGGIAYGADWTNHAFATSTSDGQTSNHYRQDGLRRWLMKQVLDQPLNIKEKMTWFWYHFIPIDFESIFQSSNNYINVNSARIFYQYMKLFQDNALGNFKTLIRNIATQPAMMFYLNNQANSATAPDENFARELMELFTLGKDPLSQYTQADVVAAAQVLTGWRVQNLNTINTATAFVSASHKTGNKQFSSFFNNTVIANAGAAELDALINMIFSKAQVVSEYICRRIYRYFVYYDIDANIEANIITPLAQTFVANNWNIQPVLDQLFKSEHFYDMANRGVMIKSPLDAVAGALRTLNVNTTVSDATNFQAQYQVWGYINDNLCLPMEQQMGTIPNVSGWNAYYQTPAYHEYWINTNTIQKRFAFLQTLFSTNGFSLTYNTLNTKLQVDYIAFVRQFGDVASGDPNYVVEKCAIYLLPVDLSLDQRNSIKQQTLLYQQVTDSYWTTAWNNYLGAPTNTSYKTLVNDRLKNLLYTLVQLAEFQLM